MSHGEIIAVEEMDVLPDGFRVHKKTVEVPPRTHGGEKTRVVAGYYLSRETSCGAKFCGSSMAWVDAEQNVNGLFKTEISAIHMANWQIEADERFEEIKKEKKDVFSLRAVLFYVNSGEEKKATKLSVQLDDDESRTLENLRFAANQMGLTTRSGRYVQSNADLIRFLLGQFQEQMTF